LRVRNSSKISVATTVERGISTRRAAERSLADLHEGAAAFGSQAREFRDAAGVAFFKRLGKRADQKSFEIPRVGEFADLAGTDHVCEFKFRSRQQPLREVIAAGVVVDGLVVDGGEGVHQFG